MWRGVSGAVGRVDAQILHDPGRGDFGCSLHGVGRAEFVKSQVLLFPEIVFQPEEILRTGEASVQNRHDL